MSYPSVCSYLTINFFSVWYERSMSATEGEKQRTMSLDLEGHKERWNRRQPPTTVLVVWLESYEDHLLFPAGMYFKVCISL